MVLLMLLALLGALVLAYWLGFRAGRYAALNDVMRRVAARKARQAATQEGP